MNRRRFLGATGVAAASFAAVAVAGTELTGEPAKAPGPVARGRRLPNVTVVTHENKQVRFYDDLIKGRTVVVNFMFTSCEDDCPLQTANMRQLQQILGDRVGRDIFLYSVSLDPQTDTPEVLAEYARAFEAAPGWTFLTGSPENIDIVRRSFGLVDPDPIVDADKEQHIGMCWIGHEPLQRWSSCPSLTRASAKARYIGWAEPNGTRPSYDSRGFSS